MIYQDNNLQISDECAAFELAAFTTIGDRKNQQDCFGYYLNNNNGIAVLCDGMGGHNEGAFASSTAAECFISRFAGRNENEPEITFMQKVIREANDIVCKAEDESGNLLNAGTTAVSVIISGKKLYWCSAGDSRAYLYRKSEFVQFTQDHNYRTVLDENRRTGIISEKEYIQEYPMADSLISYVGIDNLELVDYNDTPLNLEADDKIIIMSDGLYKLVSDKELCTLLENFGNISDALNVIEARTRSNAKETRALRDNMTVIIIKIKDTEETK